MPPIPHAAGIYLALLQLFFTLGWTVYAIYLPQLAAQVGIPRSAVILILMLDQAIFTLADFATGIAADKVSKAVGRLGHLVGAITLLSCAAFLALPFVAGMGDAAIPVFLALTITWAITSSALRAPPIMLLGKYCAQPTHPYLSALAMLGYGLAGAVAPYLAIALRGVDPRLPFLLASLAVALTAFGLTAVERMVARAPALAKPAGPARAFGSPATASVIFAAAMVVLALGYQMHFAINSGPLFLRFAKPDDLVWLMPVFWVGFNIAMFPAGLVTKKWGGYVVMGLFGLIGAAAIVGAALAPGLGAMTAAQFLAGAAWGCILMSAFTVAFAIGENGAEGRMSGLLFSALALATFARMAAVATGLQADPAFAALLSWIPTLCWALAGAALLYLAFGQVKRWAAG